MSTEQSNPRLDVIPLETASTLAGLFRERIRRTPDALAYRQYDNATGTWQGWSWAEAGRQAARWRAALRSEGLQAGDRVAIMLRNCREWVCYDLAAQSLGLVTVPLFTNDRPDNCAYILRHAEARLLLLEGSEAWNDLKGVLADLPDLRQVLTLVPVSGNGDKPKAVAQWLPVQAKEFAVDPLDPDTLATIVYTSGTTGHPKGVMLSHRNILWDIQAGLRSIPVFRDDLFLSFLPLSHTLERTVGFYMPIMTGAVVAFARSIPQLGEDLQEIRPTAIVSVPRIFERVYGKLQAKLVDGPAAASALFRKAVDLGWQRFQYRQKRGPWSPGLLLWPLLDRLVAAKVRARLGGRLRLAICGGAALPTEVARVFVGLEIPIVQGYGLTEASPIVSGNPIENNIPASVGPPLQGLEVRIGEHDELLTRSPAVMLGYWKDPAATAAVIDPDGWLHTGDKGRLESSGHLYITGRLKEIVVLANGEKVPPADMEMAIALDPLFEQVLVIGEGRPYLSAMIVPEAEALTEFLRQLELPPDTGHDHPGLLDAVLERVNRQIHGFPGYARIFRIDLLPEPWTVDNGFMTPTMKLRRDRILEHRAEEVERLYAGHE